MDHYNRVSAIKREKNETINIFHEIFRRHIHRDFHRIHLGSVPRILDCVLDYVRSLDYRRTVDLLIANEPKRQDFKLTGTRNIFITVALLAITS